MLGQTGICSFYMKLLLFLVETNTSVLFNYT